MSDLKTATVMFDRGKQILTLKDEDLQIGDHVWFGEPRNIEAVVVAYSDSHHDGHLRPLCDVLPEYLPQRGVLAGTWCMRGVGYSGFTTGLVGGE